MIKLTNADEFQQGDTLILNPRIISSITPVKIKDSIAKTAIRGIEGKDMKIWFVQESIDVVFSKLKGNML